MHSHVSPKEMAGFFDYIKRAAVLAVAGITLAPTKTAAEKTAAKAVAVWLPNLRDCILVIPNSW